MRDHPTSWLVISVLNGIRGSRTCSASSSSGAVERPSPGGLGFRGCAAHAIAGRVASVAQVVGRTPP
jgi:hypothetical protein